MQYSDRSSDIPPPRLSLAELREKIGAFSRIDPAPGWEIPKTDLVLPRGALIEVMGAGSREWLIGLFALHRETRIAWIEPELSLFPPAISQRGVSLERFLFIETEKEWNWAVLQVLRSKVFDFAVTLGTLIPARAPDAFLRKLQIEAERTGTALFFMSERETPLFGITYRIQIETEEPKILKRKRG